MDENSVGQPQGPSSAHTVEQLAEQLKEIEARAAIFVAEHPEEVFAYLLGVIQSLFRSRNELHDQLGRIERNLAKHGHDHLGKVAIGLDEVDYHRRGIGLNSAIERDGMVPRWVQAVQSMGGSAVLTGITA